MYSQLPAFKLLTVVAVAITMLPSSAIAAPTSRSLTYERRALSDLGVFARKTSVPREETLCTALLSADDPTIKAEVEEYETNPVPNIEEDVLPAVAYCYKHYGPEASSSPTAPSVKASPGVANKLPKSSVA